MLEDTLNDVLYVGGASFHAGDYATSPGIFKWNGITFEAMDCGFDWDCVGELSNGGSATPVLTLAMWDGALYAGGGFTAAANTELNHVARWNGESWEALGSGLDANVTRLRSYADGLYAVGSFTHAGGVEANGLARWDGTEWHSVFNLPLFGSSEVNLLNDMAWYNGQVYICGNFGDSNGINDIAYYDGTTWSSVANGIRGGFALVNLLEEHNGLLYVAGAFAQTQPYGPPENPGCGIVTWDGENWGQLGEGTCGSGNPTIYRMTWIQDTLYVTGRFDRIGGVPTGRVARWDGTRWCSLVPPDYFYPDIVAMGSYRDTLLVGGSFTTAGPDQIDRIAKWVGGAYTSACGTAVGISEPERVSPPISFYPDPASDRIDFMVDGDYVGTSLQIFDATGRSVLTHRISGTTEQVDISAIAPGNYFVRMGTSSGGRFVVVR